MTSSTPGPLLTMRAAVILMLALLVGILAGVLSYLDEASVPSAVLWGGGASGGALVIFHRVVGR